MSTSKGTVACSHCGALNGADFDGCIRCNRPLGDAAPADKAKRRVPARRARATASKLAGAGVDKLFGRWSADALPAAKIIIGLTMLVFAGQVYDAISHGATAGDAMIKAGSSNLDISLGSVRFGAFAPLHLAALRAEPWRLLAACFVHYGIVHIGMNMFWLVHLARLAEPAIGSARFIIAYVATGILGFVASVIYYQLANQGGFTAGASGAVFGVMGLVLGFLWRRGDPRWKLWLGQTVGYALLFGFLLPNINNSAHVGGLLAGALFGVVYAKSAAKPSRRYEQVLAAICLLAIVGSLVAAQLSGYADWLARAFAQG